MWESSYTTVAAEEVVIPDAAIALVIVIPDAAIAALIRDPIVGASPTMNTTSSSTNRPPARSAEGLHERRAVARKPPPISALVAGVGEEYARLQQSSFTGEPSLFNPYGDTNPAKLFAMISETLFERPREMASLHPALYAELRGLYRVHPASW
jgi:hypothetical protein